MPAPAIADEASRALRAAGEEEIGPLVERNGPQRPSRGACRSVGLALAGCVAIAAVVGLAASAAPAEGAAGSARAVFISAAKAAAEKTRALGDTKPNCNSKEAWSKQKQDWCCEHENKGCKMETSGGGEEPCDDSGDIPDDPEKPNCEGTLDWSMPKKEYCCFVENIQCENVPDDKKNCYTKEAWSEQKKEYCCRECNICEMVSSGRTSGARRMRGLSDKGSCSPGGDMNGGLFDEMAQARPVPMRA